MCKGKQSETELSSGETADVVIGKEMVRCRTAVIWWGGE